MIAPFAKRGGTEQPDYFCGAFHINDGGFERLLRVGHLFRYQRADKRNGFSFTLHFARDKILDLRFKHFSEGETPLLDSINYLSLSHRFAGQPQPETALIRADKELWELHSRQPVPARLCPLATENKTEHETDPERSKDSLARVLADVLLAVVLKTADTMERVLPDLFRATQIFIGHCACSRAEIFGRFA